MTKHRAEVPPALQDPSRRPRRRGKIYCSSWCGSGCTYAAYHLAKHNAKALAQALDLAQGYGWKPYVWENMGWHYSAIKGACKVHPPFVPKIQTGGKRQATGTWNCYFNAQRQFIAEDRQPEVAVAKALQLALEFSAALQSQIAELHKKERTKA